MISVLVVDDDTVDRLLVQDLLEDDFQAFEAGSGDEARAYLEREKIDCILLDFLIPGTDSLALLKEFSARRLPVIMMTGEGNEDIAVSAMKQGAQDYINKRKLSKELLQRTINNAVHTIDLKRNLEAKTNQLSDANDELLKKVVELEVLNNDLENFIHIAAHDLREPLKSLSLYCDLLELETKSVLSNKGADFISSIKRSAKRLASLIDDLRALTHIAHSKSQMVLVDLTQVIDEVLHDAHIDSSNSKCVIKRDQLPNVLGYPPFLVELYRNLLENAIKYGVGDPLEIAFTFQQGSEGAVYGVKNSGSFLSPEELVKIFQPFYRMAVHRSTEGTGMGLALCKKIVERHKGKIWAECVPDEGCHFKFTLS